MATQSENCDKLEKVGALLKDTAAVQYQVTMNIQEIRYSPHFSNWKSSFVKNMPTFKCLFCLKIPCWSN